MAASSKPSAGRAAAAAAAAADVVWYLTPPALIAVPIIEVSTCSYTVFIASISARS